jgi:glycosyltransferase involved in cell wall biosynthesis
MTADAVGGVWQYSLDLISHLAERGAEVLLAIMGPRPTDAQKTRLADIQGVTLRESDYKLEWMQEPWNDVRAAGEWLLQLAYDFRPDVVHLNGYAHAALRWGAPVMVVAHSCVYSWWNAVHGADPPASDWAEYRERIAAGLFRADAVVAPSESMAHSLTRHYGLPAARVRVIHNFSESPEAGRAEKEPLLLAAGRKWDTGKNLDFLSDIENRLAWPLRVAEGLPHEQVLQYMQRASVYVHPALYEPFGLAVLEAARAGCCLVLSDIPSLRELWDGAARFVSPRDPDAWIRTLNALAADESHRVRLSEVARAHATRYSGANTVRAYLDVYAALARTAAREGAAA